MAGYSLDKTSKDGKTRPWKFGLHLGEEDSISVTCLSQKRSSSDASPKFREVLHRRSSRQGDFHSPRFILKTE
ncbi:hypothetical protein PHLCEN_2v6285 [Hermanssonia centrifuga]|uniref:Uncharacterized protein n=1 Tax=Hermanssonia centrifuga TaxID=98765 RepID=A0A2R6NZT6_9APHY|nr:hypothetical protein PHLCEN_2v6285 [Hermanssonia centrifuga]